MLNQDSVKMLRNVLMTIKIRRATHTGIQEPYGVPPTGLKLRNNRSRLKLNIQQRQADKNPMFDR